MNPDQLRQRTLNLGATCRWARSSQSVIQLPTTFFGETHSELRPARPTEDCRWSSTRSALLFGRRYDQEIVPCAWNELRGAARNYQRGSRNPRPPDRLAFRVRS